ncbi:MAG: glycosyltransferase family 4 protein [Tatlockia sp.]|jgi:rhamnosyl/mannosyltransferase
MKILHVYKTFSGDNFGGVEQVIAQIAQNPIDKAIEHQVLSLSPNPIPKELDYLGVKNIRYKENINLASNSLSFSLFKDYYKITEQADLIHYHFPWPFADLLHLFWKIKKPAVITYHSDIVRQKALLYLYRPLMERFLGAVNALVATSPNYATTSPVLQQFQHKVSVIPIGLDKASYPVPSQARLDFWRKRFGNRFFLFIGVLRYYKGLHVLLNAAKGTTFPIVIVGTGPMEEELKKRAAEAGLTQVYFVGRLPEEDKIALLQLALCLVFPSHLRSEAFGVSLLEGAMYGKPLISCEIGTGTSYINVNQETGLVVPPNDEDALQKAMQCIWDNPEKAKAMGEKAHSRYQELFTADTMVQSYETLYRKVAHQ